MSHYYASHIQDSTELRWNPVSPNRDGDDRQQPSTHVFRVCLHAQAGYSNVLAHALQDSIVGSDSGTPKLPRSTLPVLRSTVPV